MTDAPKPTHTPGPWRLQQGDQFDHGEDGPENGFTILMGRAGPRGGPVIHRIRYADDIWPEDKCWPEARANARLIAAAPALFDALRAVDVSGPDGDGLLWLHFRSPDGKECAVSTRSDGIVGMALAGWSDMRRAALSSASTGNVSEGASDGR